MTYKKTVLCKHKRVDHVCTECRLEKRVEELKGRESKLIKLCSLLNYNATGFDKDSERYTDILELWPQVMLRAFGKEG